MPKHSGVRRIAVRYMGQSPRAASHCLASPYLLELLELLAESLELR